MEIIVGVIVVVAMFYSYTQGVRHERKRWTETFYLGASSTRKRVERV